MPLISPEAWLHFLTLAVSIFGVGVALATVWGTTFRKKASGWLPVDLPEGSYFLMWLCACIVVLTYKSAGPVLNLHLAGSAQTVAIALYVPALCSAALYVLLGAHVLIGSAFLYGDRHRNRGR